MVQVHSALVEVSKRTITDSTRPTLVDQQDNAIISTTPVHLVLVGVVQNGIIMDRSILVDQLEINILHMARALPAPMGTKRIKTDPEHSTLEPRQDSKVIHTAGAHPTLTTERDTSMVEGKTIIVMRKTVSLAKNPRKTTKRCGSMRSNVRTNWRRSWRR